MPRHAPAQHQAGTGRLEMLRLLLAGRPDRSLGELERAGFRVEDLVQLGRQLEREESGASTAPARKAG